MWLCLLRSLLCNSHPESDAQGGPEGCRCCRKWHLARGFDPGRSQTPCQTLSFCLAFLSWKLFLMETPASSSSWKSRGLLLPSFAAAPPSCTGFCVFLAKFSKQNPCGLLLLEPCWAESCLGHLGAEPLVLVPGSALAETQPDPLSASSSAWPGWAERGSQMWLVPAGCVPPSEPCPTLQPPGALLCSLGFFTSPPCDCSPHFLQPHSFFLGQFPCRDTRCC